MKNAEIDLPLSPRMHDHLPVYYRIDPKANLTLWEVGLVHSAVDHINGLAALIGQTRFFLEDPMAPVLVFTRSQRPATEKKWGTALFAQRDHWPMKRVQSCWIELHPRWFASNWGARKENLLRHELAHILGFGHSESVFSLMHPDYCTGWWPWRLSLSRTERAELMRYWGGATT